MCGMKREIRAQKSHNAHDIYMTSTFEAPALPLCTTSSLGLLKFDLHKQKMMDLLQTEPSAEVRMLRLTEADIRSDSYRTSDCMPSCQLFLKSTHAPQATRGCHYWT